jgi:hypothetical protein
VTRAKPAEATFGFCTITGRLDTRPRFQRGTFEDLYEYLESHLRMIPLTRAEFDELDKDGQDNHKSGPAVILAEFKRDGVRLDEEVLRTFGLGLDVDELHVEQDHLVSLLRGTRSIIYESSRSVPGARRWRVFIQYARPFSPEEHDAAFEHWRSIIPGVSSQSRNPSRLWYGVQKFKDSERRTIELLDGEPYIAREPKRLTGREAFLKHVKPPADQPAAEGDRNGQLSRYALSVLRDCANEEEFFEALSAQAATYSPPLPTREVRAMARNKWKRRHKFGWVSPVEVEDAEDIAPGLPVMPVSFIEPAPGIPTPVVRGWLPRKVVTLFSAHGGMGKSFVALEVAVRACLGLPVFGEDTDKVPVLFYSCEDDEAIMRWRADRFAIEFGRKPSDLDGRLFLYDMTQVNEATDFPIELWSRNESLRTVGATPTLDMLYNTAATFGCGLVIIDNISDVFGAEENNRSQVRGFMRALKARSQAGNLATLLLGHTNKPTATAKAGEDVQGYSGSTAWHNSARSRWWLAKNEGEDALTLALEKSNYGRSGQTVEVKWHDAKSLLMSGAAVKPVPMNELAGVMLTKLASMQKRGIEALVGMRASGSFQSVLRSDCPEFKRRKPTAVQEWLEQMHREGLLEKTSRPYRKSQSGKLVEVWTEGKTGAEWLAKQGGKK